MRIPANRKQTDSKKEMFRMKRLIGSAVLVMLFTVGGRAQVSVVNAASYDPGFPVSPGSLASAFGSFGTVPETHTAGVPLETTLGQVQLFVNNVAAPLHHVNSGQINFQVPASTPAGRVPIRVVNNGTEVATGTMDVLDAAPGLFFITTDPQQQGSVQNQDFSDNGEQRPAIRGQVLILYATGQGPLTSPIPDGAGAPSEPPAQTTTAPKVFISVDEAAVEFSGMAPGFAGLWQINVRIPNKSYITGQVPIFVVKDGIASNTISVWVAP
jgi:uncharacterized protein (TIGR03437 family)